ncbi:ATP-binding cassette domain-containing protein [Crenobacter cavernae]|uniref:ATP-binding cassette domain-containing protein n=1 Tax=Crenobacter cavernae TaxID=2290923 RepID=A0A345Y971_9NEIS|nr:ATP-binding cassette domain-containing protein [Crenobacter cavernae]AXK40473.1 ATP-binding cassette domain-containing protein [Crenobacter cavernae]
MLELDAVGRALGPRRLGPVSLTVAQGEVLALLGPNGAGKSSLLQLATGLARPDRGEVRLAGQAISRLSAVELASRRAVLEQAARLPARCIVREVVEGGACRQHGANPQRLAEVLQRTGVDRLADRLTDKLSGGEAQRVLLARAWYQLLSSKQAERYLLLDEPTAMLDIGAADALLADIASTARTENIGVLAVVHDLNLALRHADRVALINNGQCVAIGPTAEVMRAERLEAVYGVRLAELGHPEEADWRAFIPLRD